MKKKNGRELLKKKKTPTLPARGICLTWRGWQELVWGSHQFVAMGHEASTDGSLLSQKQNRDVRSWREGCDAKHEHP